MNQEISKKQLQEFGLLIGLGFPILIGWLLPSIAGHSFRAWTLWIGFPALLLSFLSPHLLRKPYKGWMTLGNILGWINSHLILGLVFIFVLQPIAFIMRFFNYDPLRKKLTSAATYRELRQTNTINFTRIF